MFGRAAGKQKRSEEELAELEEEEERERQEEAMEVVGEMQLTAEQLKASLLRCNWHCIFCMLDIMCCTKVHGPCAMPKCCWMGGYLFPGKLDPLCALCSARNTQRMASVSSGREGMRHVLIISVQDIRVGAHSAGILGCLRLQRLCKSCRPRGSQVCR